MSKGFLPKPKPSNPIVKRIESQLRDICCSSGDEISVFSTDIRNRQRLITACQAVESQFKDTHQFRYPLIQPEQPGLCFAVISQRLNHD